MVKDPERARRWDAVFSLREIGDGDTALSILPLLDPSLELDDGVRSETALTLAAIGGPAAIPPLLDTLRNDPSPEVRWRAALGLSSAGSPELVDELKEVLATEEDPDVREGIESAIESLGGS